MQICYSFSLRKTLVYHEICLNRDFPHTLLRRISTRISVSLTIDYWSFTNCTLNFRHRIRFSFLGTVSWIILTKCHKIPVKSSHTYFEKFPKSPHLTKFLVQFLELSPWNGKIQAIDFTNFFLGSLLWHFFRENFVFSSLINSSKWKFVELNVISRKFFMFCGIVFVSNLNLSQQ